MRRASLVVRDDRNDVGAEPADADLAEQVQEGMVELRDHGDDPRRARGVGDVEVKPSFSTVGRAPVPTAATVSPGSDEGDAQEEAVGRTVPVLVGLGDVAAKGRRWQ